MNPIQFTTLADHRIDELRRQAEAHRLATAVRTTRPDRPTGTDTHGLSAAVKRTFARLRLIVRHAAV